MTQFFRVIYYRISKNRPIRWAVLILGTAAILGAAFVLLGPWDLRTSDGRAQFLKDHPGTARLLPVYWQARKLSDVLYLPYFFRQDHVPLYSLEIAKSDLEKMNDSLPKSFLNAVYTNKVSVPARFHAGDKIYNVEVRYRGDNAIHWNAPKKSYQVKFKGKEQFFGMSEVNFIIPNDRYFAMEEFNQYRAKKLGLNVPQSGFANLDVNDDGPALYFMIEAWSPEMLEKWGVSKSSPLYAETDVEATGGDIWSDITLWQDVAHNDKYPFKRPSRLPELLGLLNEAPDEQFNAQIFELIDKDNFYAWRINQELANSTHQNLGNVRLYFDQERRKFFFVPWDTEGGPLKWDTFEDYGPLAKRIFQNPQFLLEKNAKLHAYLSDEKNLLDDLDFYDKTYESFRISLYKDRRKIFTNHYADSVYRQYREIIAGQFYRLRGKELTN